MFIFRFLIEAKHQKISLFFYMAYEIKRWDDKSRTKLIDIQKPYQTQEAIANIDDKTNEKRPSYITVIIKPKWFQ